MLIDILQQRHELQDVATDNKTPTGSATKRHFASNDSQKDVEFGHAAATAADQSYENNCKEGNRQRRSSERSASTCAAEHLKKYDTPNREASPQHQQSDYELQPQIKTTFQPPLTNMANSAAEKVLSLELQSNFSSVVFNTQDDGSYLVSGPTSDHKSAVDRMNILRNAYSQGTHETSLNFYKTGLTIIPSSSIIFPAIFFLKASDCGLEVSITVLSKSMKVILLRKRWTSSLMQQIKLLIMAVVLLEQ